MLTRKMCMSIVSIFSPCCRLISNQMCPLNLWHVQVRGVMIGLIESHGKIWWSYFFPIHLNFWCCLPGKIFLCVRFSLKIMDLHIHCSLEKNMLFKKNPISKHFVFLFLDLMVQIFILIFCIALNIFEGELNSEPNCI